MSPKCRCALIYQGFQAICKSTDFTMPKVDGLFALKTSKHILKSAFPSLYISLKRFYVKGFGDVGGRRTFCTCSLIINHSGSAVEFFRVFDDASVK